MRQAKGHEFPTFQFTSNPFSGFLVPSLTTTALMKRGFGRDAARNVRRRGQTIGARVDRVGLDEYAANTAQNLR